MKRKFTFSAMFLMLAAALLATVPAHADSVTLSLAAPNGSGAFGTTVDFYATVLAPATNTGAVYLNADSFNVGGNLVLDDSGFFNNFPLDLTPGQSYTGLLFDIALPANIPIGVPYSGFFELLGGANGGSSSTIGAVGFSVVATPEPSTFVLLGSGLLVMAGTVRRRLAV